MRNQEIEKIDFSEWPLPDKYLIEVGRVNALWASFENFLNMCIGKLSGFDDLNDPKAFILVAHGSFPQRLNILCTLCEQMLHEFPNLKPYKSVVEKIKKAQKARNKFAHNTFSYDPDIGKMTMPIGSARGSLKVRVETITIADIKRATIKIDEAQAALYKLILQVEIEPVWKRKKAQQGV